MKQDLPGNNALRILERGIPLFRGGGKYREKAEAARSKGYVRPAQIILDRAQGDFIWDIDGKRYIDLQNGWATNPLGNAHPEIIEAVHQAHQRYGFHYEHPLRYELAEKLAGIMPGRQLPRFNFEVSGTEAAEAAAYIALCHMKRRYVVTVSSAFHGESIAGKLLSAYDGSRNRYLEAWTGGVIKAPYPYSEGIPAGIEEAQYVEYCLWYLEKHIPGFIAPADSIAAVLIEPGLAEGGNWIPASSFVRGVREICDRQGWLMIADEVLTGLGRTGRMWGVEHYDVVPDLLVVGKNLSGGIEPCAGVAARDEILADNPQAGTGSTFAATPAGCAAGLKTLEIYERDRVVEHAARLAEMAAPILKGFEKYPIVGEARARGLLMGVSFRHPDGGDDSMAARAVRSYMLHHGVYPICDFGERVVRMYPALNMDENVLREALEVMEAAIVHVAEHGTPEGDYPTYPTGDYGA
ncbi:MAG: aminotransferase class III-fold pyridoxal phosphate-dependent enzyme [Gammaproteobacteria bacterium]|jgi:4-aminobutyrate aminotransferase/(S)-3-amino-2-methylpropionate transaminase